MVRMEPRIDCLAVGVKRRVLACIKVNRDTVQLLLPLADMKLSLPFAAAALALSTIACGDSPSDPSGTASVSLRLTDSPFSDAQSVLVTFSSVSVHRTGSAFSTIPFAGGATSRICDLKKLENGANDMLGTEGVPAGDYTQIRLIVASAVLYFDNPSTGPACAPAITAPAGASAAVTIPSGDVRLNRPFTLAANTATTVLLDFDGDQSIRETSAGVYSMTPVINVVSVQQP